MRNPVQMHRWIKKHTVAYITTSLAFIFFSFNSPLFGGSVVGSRHDLSTPDTTDVCVFCHTPHNASLDIQAPLWNRAVTDQLFTLYSSPTLDSAVSQPSGVSLACLGCHDGVISSIEVNGVVRDTKHQLINYHGFPDNSSYPNCERCHPEYYTGLPSNFRLGMDMSNDHPIAMDYPTPDLDPGFKTPPDAQHGWGGGDVRLVYGKVECVSCHNAHDPDISPFLIKSNDGSALCLTCHDK